MLHQHKILKFKVLSSMVLILTILVEAQAQMLTNKGQLIHITNDAIVSVEGSVLNEGTVINNGNLAISGDWDNRNSYTAGQGTFILNGNSYQTVRHNNQDFYQLQVEGIGEKFLEGNASILHTIILKNGIVTPSSTSVLLAKDGASIEGGSINSFVNGRFFQEGMGTKFFPIGKNAGYKPLLLESIEGQSLVIGYEVMEPNTNARTGEDLESVSQVRYWEQTHLSGMLSKAFLTLSFDFTENISNIDSLVVSEADEEGSVFRNLGMSKISGSVMEGTITSKLPITGKVFAIGVARNEANTNLLFIPNAFSPIAAQEEDRVVKIYGRNISQENLLFRIYNRWGNLIYESSSLEELSSKGWDGTNIHTGDTESSGVYTYTLQGKFNTGKLFKKAGTISLIK